MATLYKLTDEYTDLLARLEAAEDEAETEAVWQEMDALEDDIVEKAEAYARIMRNKQAEVEAFKAEKERLASCQKAAENVVERLKARLLSSMQRMHLTDIQTGIGKWRVQMNPYSCQIIDEADVPAEFHIPQPDKIDKAAILRQFNATGELLPGVEIAQTAGIRFR